MSLRQTQGAALLPTLKARDAQMNVIGGITTHRLREQVAEGLGLGPAVYQPFD